MDEAGDPRPNFIKIRNIIGEYLTLPNISVPEKEPKMSLPAVKLIPINSILSNACRRFIGSTAINSSKPLTFEALNQFSGLVLYESQLPEYSKDNAENGTINISTIRDSAHILVEDVIY